MQVSQALDVMEAILRAAEHPDIVEVTRYGAAQANPPCDGSSPALPGRESGVHCVRRGARSGHRPGTGLWPRGRVSRSVR
ncbi:hypothetical protein Sar04_14440 [Salinispora arenicola]|uniref:Uncharacterized protein n=1 Tax=Salinispora arenicola TaxID=168697 RepID=A0A542XK55_SALAC|nr:hypothetical protein FB564_1291 [Salinispora arenicola]GIM83875.1 hypothetical protein Sar04_14440 [Salinispora arenicola]